MLCYDFFAMSNLEISKIFRNVAASYIIKNEKKFRFQIIAYQNASEIIKNLTSSLYETYKLGKLSEIPGIGQTIKSHLEELFKTGKVRHFNWVFKGIPNSVFILMEIPSLGPKKAFKLVKKFKLTNSDTVINDLKKISHLGKIAKMEGFGKKSEASLIRSINEYENQAGKLKKMNLPYALETANKIIEYLKRNEFVDQIEVLGSLRRKKETVGDIDIAISSKNPRSVIEYFIKYPFIERVIEKGRVSASILIFGGVQVDLMIQPRESYGSLLQHLTGSKEHNIKLREVALKKGLSLSEYGIRKAMKHKNILKTYDTEKKFYNAIGLEFIPPELRENNGEIELSMANMLPKLVELKDIKGDLHIHSSYPIEPSHDLGHDSIESILKKAALLNYEYIGFSEHNPSISKHTEKQIYEILAKRNDFIEHKIESIKNVRVFKLLEVDILPNGNLPINNSTLNLLDGVIVSVHTSFNLSRDKMTKRILNALLNPKAKILGHPTGRLLEERLGYELDWDLIFDFCNRNKKAIEINSWPKRLDPPPEIIKKGVENNVKFIINTDSHALEQMDLMKYGIYMAKRGWATKNDILNCLSYNKIYSWLKGGE